MHPAPSIIAFTVLSGAGFGLLGYLALGLWVPSGWQAFAIWGLGYGLAVAGLAASTLHLGNPQRALRAFSQWRTSWLSREAWAAVVTLASLAPYAMSDWLGWGLGRGFGIIGALLCGLTVFCTSMIYAQIKAVPRWHHWITPLMFLSFAAAGGAVLAGERLALLPLALLAIVMLAGWRIGDGQFARAAQTIGSATGLGRIGEVSVFERGHTAGNYLLREMIYVVGRKHAVKLRAIAAVLTVALPFLVLALFRPTAASFSVAAVSHIAGALAARWLFFAEAEHVVGLYYGERG